MRLFPEEGPAGGCASGECLPDAAPTPAAAPAEELPTPVVVNVRLPSPPEPEPEEEPEPEAEPAPARASPDTLPNAQERWRGAVERVRQASARHGKSLAFGRLLWMRPGEVAVGYTRADDFHRSTVSGTGKPVIEKALSEFFGQRTALLVQDAPNLPPGALPVSLAEQEAQDREAHARSTDARVRSHPATRAVLRVLGGELEHIQVLEKEQPTGPAPESEASDDNA